MDNDQIEPTDIGADDLVKFWRAIKAERIERLYRAIEEHGMKFEGSTLMAGQERLNFTEEPQVFCDLCNRIKYETELIQVQREEEEAAHKLEMARHAREQRRLEREIRKREALIRMYAAPHN